MAFICYCNDQYTDVTSHRGANLCKFYTFNTVTESGKIVITTEPKTKPGNNILKQTNRDGT